jgi:hypothetical protein
VAGGEVSVTHQIFLSLLLLGFPIDRKSTQALSAASQKRKALGESARLAQHVAWL